MKALVNFPYAGAWELQRFCISYSDNRPLFYPFGEAAKGRIIYTEAQSVDAEGDCVGQVSAALMAETRPRMSSQGLEDGSQANTLEKAAAFDSYLHYAGRYTWKGDCIVHHVDLALNPAVLGTEQIRALHYANDTGVLTLNYGITARSGVERRYQLIWQRVNP